MRVHELHAGLHKPNFIRWGLIPYEDALREQLVLVQKVYSGELPDTIIFCSHEPIVTKGRNTQPTDIFGWSGPTIEIQRGGRATYHGPSQLVIYPIVNLQRRSQSGEIKILGIRQFLSFLENVVVQVLKIYGVAAQGRCGEKLFPQALKKRNTLTPVLQEELTGGESCQSRQKGILNKRIEATGVWVGPRKICSLGIGVKKWVSYHGLALNVEYDPKAFQGIHPCGFSSNTMMSLEEILNRRIPHAELITNFKNAFLSLWHLVDGPNQALKHFNSNVSDF